MSARHAKQREAAMEMATASLPNEIMAEILSRLPVKSLGRFRCVSKPWRSLISDPHFIKIHLKRRLTQKVFLSFLFRLKIQFVDHEVLVHSDVDEKLAVKNLELPCEKGSARIVKILGSCNGLLCLGLGVKDIIVWNPCIGEYKKLQQPDGLGSYGFGYDSCNDDYKLVKVIPRNGSDVIEVNVFSLRTNSWRRVYYGGCNFDLVDYFGTLFNGSIYWQARHGDGDAMKTTMIVSFDVVKEKFRELPKPDCEFAEGPMLGVLGDRLCTCRFEYLKDVEVWAMKEDGEEVSWVKIAIVSPRKEPEYIRDYSVPLCFAKNGEAVMLKGGQKLDVYNFKKNSCRRIYLSSDNYCEFDGALYVESLVSPNAYGGADGQTSSIGEKDQEKVKEEVARLKRLTSHPD